MSGSLTLRNRQRSRSIDLRLLREIVNTLLRRLLQIEDYELSIQLVDAEEITRLNEQYVRHRGATDVITFDYSSVKKLSGDIAICVDEAVSQARSFRTTWQHELVRYVVHGVLHLLGYNDHKAAARRRMKRKEDELVQALAATHPLGKLALPNSRARK